MTPTDDRQLLCDRISDLERRLAEAEETLRALSSGEVDAVVATGPDGRRQVYTLKGADEPYRLLVQQMADGAVTISADGYVLFSNQRFADTVASPLERVIGCRIFDFMDPDSRNVARALLDRAADETAIGSEINLRTRDGQAVPAYLSVNRLRLDGADSFCAVVTDLSDQKRSAQVAAAEKLARSILEQAAEAILVTDPKGRVLRASRPADRLAGRAVLLQRFDDVLTLSRVTGEPLLFGNIIQNVARETGIEALEVNVRGGGAECAAILNSAPLFSTDGELLGCIIQLTDITERKRVEEALRQSEQMYRTLADAMPHIVYINRADGRCEFVNRQWAEYTGNKDFESALEFDWSDRLHPDDRSRVLERWGACVQDVRVFECEYRLQCRDGEYRWHLSRAIPVLEEERRVTRWIGTSTDIHDLKLAEWRVRESEVQLRTIMEAVPDILFTTHADGHCDYVSARAYALSGFPDRTLEGFGWFDAIHPEDRERVRAQWAVSASTGAPFTTEYRFRAGDRYRWMIVRALAVTGPDGQITKWFGNLADIQDRKELEESLRERSAELARSNDELQRFAYVVSHDLQEPLRTITSMSQLLGRKCRHLLDGESQELLEQITAAVARMTSLIRDLLDYSSVTSHQGSTSPLKPTDSNALLQFALMNLQGQISHAQAVVTSQRLPIVLADDQLVRVFQNLIGNALKYRSASAPEIHISATEQGSMWTIAVRDNGIGLDMAHAESIFGVFKRLHGRAQYEGTGIGLAIAKRLIERYGGRIWVESKLGCGSTFFFTLPAVADCERAKEAGQAI